MVSDTIYNKITKTLFFQLYGPQPLSSNKFDVSKRWISKVLLDKTKASENLQKKNVFVILFLLKKHLDHMWMQFRNCHMVRYELFGHDIFRVHTFIRNYFERNFCNIKY